MAYRPHVKVGAAIKARAAAAGLTLAEYTEYVMAKHAGLPPECAPQPAPRDDNQEALLPDPYDP